MTFPPLAALGQSSTSSVLPANFSRMAITAQIENVTAATKANVYFDGKVISHVLFLADGTKKTLGVIFPGTYHFATDKAEAMEIVAGGCAVRIDGQGETRHYNAGDVFQIPAKSGFDIAVVTDLCEYICTFID